MVHLGSITPNETMNKTIDWRLLKKLYAIHSPSGKEDKMIAFLVSYLKSLPGVELGKDAYGNLYAWKGETESYPCIVAHLDQVQRNHPRDFRAIETRDIIFGYSTKDHSFCGLGADDKNGIIIALESIKKYDYMKVAFFREEETGCHGSSHAEMRFFDDCRYVIQCDRRGNSDLITNIGCTDLCSEKFIQDIDPEHWGYKEGQGLMTDVETLKEKGLSVSAINISCGYYNPHTDEEITVKRDLEKCWRFVQHIIEDCTEIYPHEVGENGYFNNDYLWDLEDEIYSILQQDPTMTGADLYDMYQTNFPMLSNGDFERIVDEYHLMYGCDDEDTTNQTFKPDGKEIDKEDITF